MKLILSRFFVLAFLLGTAFLAEAQGFKFYGLSSAGPEGVGSIFALNPDGSGYQDAFNFSDPGTAPTGQMVKCPDGKFYGMTSFGGTNGMGVIYSYDPATATQKKLYSFDNVSGAYPIGSLTLGSDGKLYGMAQVGGSGFGVIFGFDPSSNAYSNLYSFDYSSGANPNGSLELGLDGKLYGMTADGNFGYGGIFSFDPVASTYSSLYSFNGGYPSGDLTLGLDGKFYGMTLNGGSSSYGVIFSYDPVANNYLDLYSFDSTNGAYPYGSLTIGPDGKFYGMTYAGSDDSAYGVIFSYDPLDNNYQKVYGFNGAPNGSPQGNLTLGSDGKLYGLAPGVTAGHYGVIFMYDPLGSGYSEVYTFDNMTGSVGNSNNSLAANIDGKLYGTTLEGGLGNGVIFSYDALAGVFSKLYAFGPANGAYPMGSLTVASDGKFYGMAASGGSNGYGTLFSFDPANSNYNVLYNFDNVNGRYPISGLTSGSDGKLYGTAGVIFSYDPASGSYNNLFSFNNSTGSSQGSLALGSDGKFYGLVSGGSTHYGGIFRYDPVANTYSNLYSFDLTNGADPYGNLTQGTDGKFYGLTSNGGNNYGVIFSYDPFAGQFSNLYNFDNTNGANPSGSLTLRSDGKFYGMAHSGGSHNLGVIFAYDPATGNYANIYSFDGSGGSFPSGSLSAGTDGKLYGTTGSGGTFGTGVAFAFDPAISGFTKLHDFAANSGRTQFDQPQLYLGLPQSPTSPSSNITFSNLFSTQLRIDFTAGNGAKHLVVLRETSAVSWTPVDGQDYVAIANFSLATDQGNGNKVLMADASSQVDITGLKAATTYFVKVFEYNGTGTQTKFLTAGAPTASKKTLALPNVYVTSPANNGVNYNVAFTLTAAPLTGATNYTIELNTAQDFSDSSIVFFGARTQSVTGLTFNTRYYARVKTDLSPDYGKVTSFTTAPAEYFAYVVGPANGAVGVSLAANVTSNVVIGAVTYTIELSTDPNFLSPLPFVKTGGKMQSFNGLLTYSTKYYTRVKTDQSPNYGVVGSFTTVAPDTYVSSPANNAINQLWNLNVSANAVVGAVSYTIQLSQDANFLSGVIESTGPIRTLAFSGLAYGAKYYSRVTTDIGLGVWGPVKNFTVADPSFFSYLTSPVTGATNVNWVVNLTANTVMDATSYTIEANTDPNFGAGTAIVKSGPTKTIGFTLDQDQQYFVRVQTNLSSSWGISKSFTTGDAVSLAYVTSPKDKGVGVPTTVFVYSNVLTGATSYTIELNTAPDFSGVSVSGTGITNAIKFIGLSQNTTYYTRVKTNLGGGAWGFTSTSFTTLNSGARGRDDWRGDESETLVGLESFRVKVFGNPFGEKLTFLIETPEQQAASVVLFDMTGRTIHQSEERTNSFIEIEKSMPQGLYLLQIRSGADAKVIRVAKKD